MTSEDDVPLRRLSPRSTEAAEPSPACDALKDNLRADDGGSGLKKRKSWFGSMREVFHKGALQAKAAVDSMRGDGSQVKGEEERKPMMETYRSPIQSSVSPECTKSNHHESITPEPRESLDSAASTTPLKSHTLSPQLSRHRTFSPREAVSSLRQHLHSHGSRSKRGSVYTIVGRTSTDAPDIAGPEQFASPNDRDGGNDVEQHGRKNSVASSLVGSIRGLARRPTKSKATTPAESASMPADPAEEVPLPSSPINIPSVAPVLGLDLGLSGMNFLPAEMAGADENTRDEETRRLQDPANFGIQSVHRRKLSLPLVPDEVKMQYTHPAIKQRPITPDGMLLKLPGESLRPSPPAAPTTPMPGTNLSIELDGVSDSASSGKKSRVFERSVTPTTQDSKELRKMCSLDAIADACNTTRKDSVVETCGTVREKSQHRTSPEPGSSLSSNRNPFSPRVSRPSASTMSDCPSDMPPLARQTSGDSRLYQFRLGDKSSSVAPIPIEDPFDDSHVASQGPPSPVRSVRLPLRLKVKGPSDESAASYEAPLSPTPVTDQDELQAGAQCTFETPTKWTEPNREVINTEQRLHRNHAVPQNLSNIEQRPVSPLSPEQTQILSDDFLNRAQSLFNSDVVYPGYDDYPMRSDEGSEDGMSPHGGPMVPGPFSHGGDSSPGSVHGQSTWRAGLGGDTFKFSIDTWRPPGTQPFPDPQPQLTPNRRVMDVSIDSVSADDEIFETPIGSRASTKSGRAPSMGNKLELDARRSERNMRYNALNQEQAEHGLEQKSSSPVRMHARFIFGGSSGDMDPNEAQYYPDYSAVVDGPHAGSPEKSSQRPGRVSSEDSMTLSLRSASDNMERLRALLGDIDSDDEEKVDQKIVDAFTTASSPRSKHPIGRKDRAVRSDSPSPEPGPSQKLPATPATAPVQSPPTPSHIQASHNSFTALDIEIDIVSSLGSDNIAIADLPVSVSKEDRVGSGDTLDQTLDMLSSPESGYKADDSSDVQTPGSGKQIPRRYRSQSARKGRKALGDISGNRS